MRVYIASTFRTDEQRRNVRLAAKILAAKGIEAAVPMDYKEPGAWQLANGEWARRVMRHDVGAIDGCDAVLLLYYGDHGATQPGTCFECGYAFARGIPVIGAALTREPVSLMIGSSFRAMLDGLEGIRRYDFRALAASPAIRELV
jgi:nucleoside 2-deoxyribosyltransferase